MSLLLIVTICLSVPGLLLRLILRSPNPGIRININCLALLCRPSLVISSFREVPPL